MRGLFQQIGLAIALGIYALSLSTALALTALSYGANKTYSSRAGISVTPSSHPYIFKSNGPCVGLSSCKLQTQAFRPYSGYAYREIVTYKGRLWMWKVSNSNQRTVEKSGVYLTSMSMYMRPRYAGLPGNSVGPCASDHGCEVQHMRFYTNGNGSLRQEVFTSTDFWIYDQNDRILSEGSLCSYVNYYDVSLPFSFQCWIDSSPGGGGKRP